MNSAENGLDEGLCRGRKRGVTAEGGLSGVESRPWKGGRPNCPDQYGGIATFCGLLPNCRVIVFVRIAQISTVGLRPAIKRTVQRDWDSFRPNCPDQYGGIATFWQPGQVDAVVT